MSLFSRSLSARHVPREQGWEEVDYDREFVASRGDISEDWPVPAEFGPLPRRVPSEHRVVGPVKRADEDVRSQVSQSISDVGAVARSAAKWGLAASLLSGSADDLYDPQARSNQSVEARQRVVIVKMETWVAKITKRHEDEPLGLKVAIDMDKKLSLIRMPERPGPVWRYGEESTKLALRPGDIIAGVNGKRGTAATILEVMQHTKELTVRVVRNVKFVVSFSGVRDLGLSCRAVGKHLVVHSIRAGSDVAEANTCALSGCQICPGDIIERINGTPGAPSELLKALEQAAGDVDLSVRRPAAY